MTRSALLLVTLLTFGAAAAGPVSADEPSGARLVTSMPVTALAVSGWTVGYATGTGEPNEGAVFVWSIRDGRVIRKGTAAEDNGWLGDVALTGAKDDVVWIKGNETNHVDGWVLVGPTSRRGGVRTLYRRTDEDVPSHVAADRGVVVFSTDPGFVGRPALVWAGSTRKVRAMWKTAGSIEHVTMEGDLAVATLRGGAVEVLRITGAPIRAFPRGTALGGLAIDGGRLVVVGAQTLSVIDPVTGRKSLSRPISRKAKLLDARGDLVVYRTGAELRVQRLSDGKKARIPTETAATETPPNARFGASGLVTASGQVLRIVSQTQLTQLLDG